MTTSLVMTSAAAGTSWTSRLRGRGRETAVRGVAAAATRTGAVDAGSGVAIAADRAGASTGRCTTRADAIADVVAASATGATRCTLYCNATMPSIATASASAL